VGAKEAGRTAHDKPKRVLFNVIVAEIVVTGSVRQV